MKKAITIILAFCLCNWLLAQSIIYGEYFFDNKKDYGTGTPITINNPNGNLTLDFNISVDTLSEGLHRLFVRFRDSNGEWSQTHSYDILIKRESELGIVSGEYFFDTKVEYGDGHPLSLSTPANIAEVVDTLQVDTMSEGLHHLFIRFKDSEGLWSQTFRFNVLVKHNSLHYIVGGEYFFDTLVEYGDGFELDVDNLAAITTSSDAITAPSNLTPGPHIMFYRFVDNKGLWSHTFSEPVCANVVYGEYSTDTTDYCFGDTVFFQYSGSTTQHAVYNWDLDSDGAFDDWQSNGSPFSYVPTSVVGDTATFRYRITSSLCGSWNKVGVLKVHVSPQTSISQAITGVSCFGYCDGGINISVAGGTPPFAYQWSNNSAQEDQTNLCAGQYLLTVTDALGCVSQDSFLLSQPVPLSVGLSAPVVDASCGGSCDGAISVSVAGGTPPISYLWNNGSVLEDQSGLCEGQYSLTVTDAHDCETGSSFAVGEPDTIVVNIDTVGNESAGQGNGFIEISILGGTPPYSLQWQLNGVTISNQEDPMGLMAGNYELILLDNNGCEYSTSILIDNVLSASVEPNQSRFNLFPNPANKTLFIQSSNQASIVMVRIYGLTGQLVYSEKNEIGFTTINIEQLPAGSYYLLLSDEKGGNYLEIFEKIGG